MAQRKRKISGGGSWDGTIWIPQGASDEARARADEYRNEISEEQTVFGRIVSVRVFDGRERFALMPQFAVRDGEPVDDGSAPPLLLPGHAALNRLSDVGEGTAVEISYTGQTKTRAGQTAHTYEIFEIEDPQEDTPF